MTRICDSNFNCFSQLTFSFYKLQMQKMVVILDDTEILGGMVNDFFQGMLLKGTRWIS